MKNSCLICVISCLSILYYGCSNTSSKDKAGVNLEQVALADSILTYFQHEQFDKIIDHFDDMLKLQMNKEQLSVIWAQLNVQVGAYTKNEFYGSEKINNVGDKIIYTCYFGPHKLYYQLILGKENRVIGLFFKPQQN